jgi:glycosyltransferase involved in cell wall biosynthesis
MVPLLLSRQPFPAICFDLGDIDHVVFTRDAQQPPHWRGKPLLKLRVPLIKRWERNALRAAARTFVCSNFDRDQLVRVHGRSRLDVVPNAVNIPSLSESTSQPTLLFLGRMTYAPNAAAAAYLMRAIWPHIRAALPVARLMIAGLHPELVPGHDRPPPGVEFLGFVDDLAALYDQVAVVCAPILSGSGTRIKIVEAAAYGKPVVSTTIGAEGLDMEDGKHLLLRDDPVEFARACVALLDDPDQARRLGSAARAFVAERYARPAVVENIRRMLREVIDARTEQPLRVVE